MADYQIIYADPPWTYEDKAVAGERGVAFKYPLMSLAELMALPVGDLAADDAVLLLWGTSPLLPEALAVMDAWGFKYKTKAFTWIKTNKNTMGLFWGMGNWTRSNSEDCWLGIRGKPQRVAADIHQVVMSEIREHSRKPAIVRDLIVRLMGDVPRIELFARRKIDGWDAWGNEVESDITL